MGEVIKLQPRRAGLVTGMLREALETSATSGQAIVLVVPNGVRKGAMLQQLSCMEGGTKSRVSVETYAELLARVGSMEDEDDLGDDDEL